MRFDNGMLGVCISVCAVMGMVLSGFVLSVGEYEQTVTGYEYVTDVSGLFEYTDRPTFIEYNPSLNWTGYYTDDRGVTAGIDYTSRTNPANNYPIQQENIVVDSKVLTPGWDDYAHAHPPGDGTNPSTEPTHFYISDSDTTEGEGNTAYIRYPTVVLLSDILTSLTSDDSWTDARVSFTPGSIIAAPQSAWTSREVQTNPGAVIPVYITNWFLSYSEYATTAVLDIDRESGVVRAYGADGNYIANYQLNGLTISYNSGAPTSSTAVGLPNLSNVLSVEATVSPTPIYMDISQGVSLSSAEPVSWINEYRNGRIDILFRAASASVSYSNTFSMPLTDLYGALTEEEMILTVTVPQNGNVTVTLASGSETDTVTLGKWRNFMVSLDTVNGRYTAMPVTDFVSFTTYEAQESSGQDLELGIDGRAFTEMSISYAGSSLTFGVVDTATFLDTYDAVMVDPHLDISDYFTELADLRLNLFSFAVYGDSITINSQTYAVNNNAQINIPDTSGDEPVDRWLTLTNIYITFEGSNTYITFNNDSQTIDLGPTVSTEISMAGVWYFTTGLYEGYTTTQTALEWDYHNFIYDSNAAIVAFLGILAVGTVLGSRLVRGGMSVLDYIVVGFAALCAVVLMVV